jgi:Tol biopolymer transport system component
MDGSTPFELINYDESGIQASRGIWSPDGAKAAFFSGDALCVVPVSPETGHATGPFKKIHNEELRWQSSPSWSPDGKKLTYYGPDGNIWTINTDGSNLKQITDRDARELGPAWSPDGKIIAFGIGNRSLGLYDVEVGTSNHFMEVGMRCFPIWSPDGEWIMLDWQKHHFINQKEKSKFEITIPEEVGRFFSWSPKGDKMLYFYSSYHNDTGLKIASSAGGPSFEPVPYLVNWSRTKWSEDSRLMGVQGENDNGDIAIRIVPLTGGKSFLIDLDNLIEEKPFPFEISTNLDKILFDLRREDGKEDLYVVPISAKDAQATGPALKIFDGWYREGAYNIKFSLSPDGEKVALIHDSELWIAYTNGDEPMQVKYVPEKVGYIRWIPDGKSLLFNTRSGWNLIQNPGPDGSISKLLDDGKELEVRWPNIRFSPDCNRIAILSNNQIKILSFNEKKSTQILDINEPELYSSWDLQWSPKGENIAFIGMFETDDPIAFPDGKYQIFNIPLDGGRPIKVAPNDYDTKYGLSWSPDGKWIAYSSEKPVKIRPESYIWAADYKEVLEKLQK